MEDQTNQTLDRIQQMIDDLDVKSVFGAATTEGDYTLIPVATVMYGFGYGSGSGPGKAKKGEGATGGATGGATDDVEAGAVSDTEGADIVFGGGGGGGGRVTPCGFIRIGPDGVRYEGTYNATLIPIAGMLTGMWSIMWIAMTVMTAFTMLGVRQKDWGGWMAKKRGKR
jgi:uncharacterized spore protein YtfJ